MGPRGVCIFEILTRLQGCTRHALSLSHSFSLFLCALAEIFLRVETTSRSRLTGSFRLDFRGFHIIAGLSCCSRIFNCVFLCFFFLYFVISRPRFSFYFPLERGVSQRVLSSWPKLIVILFLSNRCTCTMYIYIKM